MKKNTKKRIHKTSDPTWNTHTYSGSSRSEFDLEWVKYYNKAEGRDQIIFLYKNKDNGDIVKYRILR